MYWKSVVVAGLIWGLVGSAYGVEASLAARWDFGTEETTPLAAHGGVKRDQAGPVSPEFPDFPAHNTAVYLDGDGSYLAVDDPGADSPFDFKNGDAITLEAWVNIGEIRTGQPMYVVGKGRTNNPRFPKDNQNWALRVVGADGGVGKLSFLFRSGPGAGGGQWHRWTSKTGFHVVTGWHHVAVSYRFGDPASIRGWIDGQSTEGTWDMGGATHAAPVVDDDAIWIGSSLGGNPGNSFHGALDAIAIHRTIPDDAVMVAKFNRVGGPRVIGPLPEVMPDFDALPPGKVLMTFSEGMATHTRWLNEGEAFPEETLRWSGDAFLLPRIPLRYDTWGIRDSWKAPVLVRMAADVSLPAGTHRFLVRARALGRLWVDGEIIARTEAMTKQPPNGEEPITPLAVPPHPGLRVPGYRMQEVFGEVTFPEEGPTTRRVVFETVVGGKSIRTEAGETLVAVETPDGKSFDVLQAQGNDTALPLTDNAVAPVLARAEDSLGHFDDANRHDAAASRTAHWEQRHDVARQWVAEKPAPAAPVGARAETAHPVDAFLLRKIAVAQEAASGDNLERARQFHNTVLPILQEGCFRCHGEKEKGGLRLNSREALLAAGDSEIPAVVPGDLAASELINRIRSTDEDVRMPPTGTGLPTEQVATLEAWVKDGAPWPASPDAAANTALAPVVSDAAFLRRLFLDTVGLPPTDGALRDFLADADPYKRFTWVDRMVADERSADHWMGYWMDILAENPTIINASLNSTGPFRWFLLDALRDNKPLDQMVTELILMRGSRHEGGSAGFSMAAENDAPMAAKGHILASAFLGVEMQCARCHDAPYHSSTQRDLFSLAAMLSRKAVSAPKSSTVPAEFFETMDRAPLIRVTLKPGEAVEPQWPFGQVSGVEDGPAIDALMEKADDARERLATLITAPQNERFAEVMVNRVWKRLMGAGIVEPVYDWEGHPASHPELLQWLAREFVAHDYDLRHILRLIMTSDAYQREATGKNLDASPEQRFFNAPEPRRLTAEQVVDSLFAATGAPMEVEELTFVHDGRRPVSNRLTLGTPYRAWMFASLANERDRPSLTLPRAQAVTDVLEAFGWTGSRQQPITHRETEPNVLQPGILANGTLSLSLTRAAVDSYLADLAVETNTPESLVETLFLRFLGRLPDDAERKTFVGTIAEGFDVRILPAEARPALPKEEPLPLVTWFNHLQSDANTIQQQIEQRVRRGPPADPRLEPEWRERYEDLVWSLVNHREFVWVS